MLNTDWLMQTMTSLYVIHGALWAASLCTQILNADWSMLTMTSLYVIHGALWAASLCTQILNADWSMLTMTSLLCHTWCIMGSQPVHPNTQC